METTLYRKDARGDLRVYKLSIALRHPKTNETVPYVSSYKDIYPSYVPVKITTHGKVGMKQTTNISRIAIPKTKRGAEQVDTFLSERFERYISDLRVTGYQSTKTAAMDTINTRPMLLTKYEPKRIKNYRDYWIQPKIDGERCVVTFNESKGCFQFKSRRDKEFYGLDHLNAELMQMRSKLPPGKLSVPDIMIDGELFIEGFDLQKIHGIISKRVDLSPLDIKRKGMVKYIVFDLVWFQERDEGFIDRWHRLDSFFRGKFKPQAIHLIDIYEPVSSAEELDELHQRIVDEGYEGVVLRRASAPYRFGKRAGSDTMKKKFHKEADYKVVGFAEESKGKYRGAVIWICEVKMPSGGTKTFNVVPDGTKADRIRVYKEVIANPAEYIGRLLQVRYYDKTTDGMPKFANSALYPKSR